MRPWVLHLPGEQLLRTRATAATGDKRVALAARLTAADSLLRPTAPCRIDYPYRRHNTFKLQSRLRMLMRVIRHSRVTPNIIRLKLLQDNHHTPTPS